MMVFHFVSAFGCHKMELMAWELERAARCGKCAMKFIARIFHAIFFKYSFKAAFIKGTVVSHKWQSFYFIFDLRPYLREVRLSVSVKACKSMDFSSPISIVVGGRLYEAVKFINNLSVTNYNNANTAYA